MACLFFCYPHAAWECEFLNLQHLCGGNGKDTALLNISNWLHDLSSILLFCGVHAVPTTKSFLRAVQNCASHPAWGSLWGNEIAKGPTLPRWTRNLSVCVLNCKHWPPSNVHTARPCRQSAITLGYCNKRMIEF